MKYLIALLFAWSANALHCKNGVYISSAWWSGKKTEKDIDALIANIETSNIKNIYLYGSGMTGPAAKGLIERLKKKLPPDTKIIGHMSRVPCPGASGCTDLTQPSSKASAVGQAQSIWSAGFDGVQFDFEPVANDDKHFLEILEQAKNKKPPGKMISVAGYFLNHGKGNPKVLSWNESYYKAVLSKVDQVMVMNYDSGKQMTKDEYVRLSERQTREIKKIISESSAEVELQVGLLTDVQARVEVSNKETEKLANGMAGVLKAMDSSCYHNSGVTLFTVDGMNPQYWQQFTKNFASGIDANNSETPAKADTKN